MVDARQISSISRTRPGLTNDITALVFEETLASLDAINAAFGATPRLGFNIAAKQACDTRFMRDFLDELAASGQRARFMLEITEEAFLPSSQFQYRILPMIREIGAHISIDDFGSGFSSLATLADITADEVKVDRSLITDIDKRPRSQSLLRAIESIGEALATEVVVEGVETEAEFRYLRDHTRIRVAQGYLFRQAADAVGRRGRRGVAGEVEAGRRCGGATGAGAEASSLKGPPRPASTMGWPCGVASAAVAPRLGKRREFAAARHALRHEQSFQRLAARTRNRAALRRAGDLGAERLRPLAPRRTGRARSAPRRWRRPAPARARRSSSAQARSR